jgi:4-amino-4-deoxy-L-arabinose transferase-like glycosyltransferase
MDPGAPQPLTTALNRRDLCIVLALWLACLVLDGLWIRLHQAPPAWDQGEHLSRAIGIWDVLRQPAPWSSTWWHQLWAEAPSYRGPLTYVLSAPVLQLFGPGFRSAMASNALVNGLLLISCYGLGRQVHSRSAGLWAACFAAMAPALLNQRTDYLIDLSLTAVLSGCWWLLSQRRWQRHGKGWCWSLLAGVGLAAVFLTRPTGLVLLWLPLLLLAGGALRAALKREWRLLLQVLSATTLAAALCWPWWIQNWLTILSTVNKARQWGVAYQDGLEANSLEGWLYYPRLLPTMTGGVLVALVLSGSALALLQSWRSGNWKRPIAQAPGWWLWWLSLPVGGLLVCTLMTSKDFRFVLPLLPQLCVGLGVLVAQVQARWAPLWRLALVVVAVQAALWNQFGWGINLSGFPSHRPNPETGWPLEAIVATVRNSSPHQLSTLAVLPDSERLNAFNLDAEGRRQQQRVAARQTVAPLESAGEDLNRFDWFLLKDGDQGVMSDERQARQTALLQASPAFLEAGRWPLPDGSTAVLMRRGELSLAVQPLSHCTPGPVEARVQPHPQALDLTLDGPASALQGARLLIDLPQPDGNGRADQAVGLGMLRLDALPASRCIRVEQRLAATPGSGKPIRIQLLDAQGRIQPLNITEQNSTSSPTEPLINRVSELQQLGGLLQRGELDELFRRVGPLNQSDPQQVYLADSEAVLQARLKQNPGHLRDLYALAVAQALQRRADAAAGTLQQINRLDPGNGSALMGLGVVQLYRFKPKAAQQALDAAAMLTPDNPTLNTLRIVASALRLDLRQVQALLK